MGELELRFVDVGYIYRYVLVRNSSDIVNLIGDNDTIPGTVLAIVHKVRSQRLVTILVRKKRQISSNRYQFMYSNFEIVLKLSNLLT